MTAQREVIALYAGRAGTKRAALRPPWIELRTRWPLLDDLHDRVGARIDKHRPLIHDRIAIVANAVLGRDFVVGQPARRQPGADAHLLGVVVGRDAALDHIAAELGPLLVGDAADDGAADAADDGTDRPAADRPGRGAGRGTALGLRRERRGKKGDEGARGKKVMSHESSPGSGDAGEPGETAMVPGFLTPIAGPKTPIRAPQLCRIAAKPGQSPRQRPPKNRARVAGARSRSSESVAEAVPNRPAAPSRPEHRTGAAFACLVIWAAPRRSPSSRPSGSSPMSA